MFLLSKAFTPLVSGGIYTADPSVGLCTWDIGVTARLVYEGTIHVRIDIAMVSGVWFESHLIPSLNPYSPPYLSYPKCTPKVLTSQY